MLAQECICNNALCLSVLRSPVTPSPYAMRASQPLAFKQHQECTGHRSEEVLSRKHVRTWTNSTSWMRSNNLSADWRRKTFHGSPCSMFAKNPQSFLHGSMEEAMETAKVCRSVPHKLRRPLTGPAQLEQASLALPIVSLVPVPAGFDAKADLVRTPLRWVMCTSIVFRLHEGSSGPPHVVAAYRNPPATSSELHHALRNVSSWLQRTTMSKAKEHHRPRS